MIDTKIIKQNIFSSIESKPMLEDLDNWNKCLNLIEREVYVPLQFKPGFIDYQKKYFEDVYDTYEDISMVLYRGGKPVGIWPLCVFIKDERIVFGTAGGALMGPILVYLPKAEAQRKVIENILLVIVNILKENGGGNITCCETIIDNGASQWTKKLMEHGAKVLETRWQAFVDLSLTTEEIQSRIRRTNKYSIQKGEDTYDVEVFDESCNELEEVFEEFHTMHRKVSGRETRSKKTWDAQLENVKNGNAYIGKSFVIFIRDKKTKELAGTALFDCTPQSAYYCVAAYDRTRFSKPVGHIVQAVAIEKMKQIGIRWYELGERPYPGNNGADEKTVAIGHYKEGFATHLFPRVFVNLNSEEFFENILK